MSNYLLVAGGLLLILLALAEICWRTYLLARSIWDRSTR
jgi:hypothetical protein